MPSDSTSNSKLSRLLDEYEFERLGERIEAYWLDDTDSRYSLRELATYINQQLLRTTMREAGMNPLDGEVENTYRLLTDSDVSTGTHTQARRRLNRAGVDVDQLELDFVSRQAVHTYLRKDRGVSYSPDKDDALEREAENIQRLNRRMTTIIGSKIEQLRNSNDLTIDEFETFIDVRILCKECDTQYQISNILDRGECECSDTR